MAYNYGAPGGYGQQPSFDQGNVRPNAGGPGVYMGAAQPFQPPQNMPNVNFNAPVMRMGVDGRRDQQGYGDFDGRGPGDGRNGRYDNRGGRPGLGADSGGGRNIERDRQQLRENMLATQPPTREEVARTIFVGGLGESAPPDEVIESILRCAGKLRRWTRARDAMDKKCRFGFAEYEDVDSLECAKEVFGDGIEIPVYKDGKIAVEESEEAPQMSRLLVVIDEQSSNYIDEWMSKRREGEDAKQFRLDGAKEDLRQCMSSLRNANAFTANGFPEGEGDVTMVDAAAPLHAIEPEAIASLDDELADIPAEMRATVAQEIKNFRDRSNRRDLERVRQEEEFEIARSRPNNRLASPLLGPAGVSNGNRPGVVGAPAGPKGYRGAQLPSDYVNGVAFVGKLAPEDESDASDSELEGRRRIAKAEEQDKHFQDAERRWLNRERQRTAAQEREHTREAAETRERERQREAMARKLSTWDDDEEERNGREERYLDRSSWARKRAVQREREAREDDRDRQLVQREKEAERRREDESRGAADRFLAETGAEIAAAKQAEPATNAVKISLGGAAARNKPAAQPMRTMADLAGLLEHEEDAASSGPPRQLRALQPVDLTSNMNAGADMSDEERTAARQALAADIPLDTESLFAWEVRWSYLSPELLEREIRPFVEKKVVEYLGLQEDFLVDLVIDGLKAQKSAIELKADLEEILDDDAESFVKKLWRLVVYFGEAEGRGLV